MFSTEENRDRLICATIPSFLPPRLAPSSDVSLGRLSSNFDDGKNANEGGGGCVDCSPYSFRRIVLHLRYQFLPPRCALSSAGSLGRTSWNFDDGKNANDGGGGCVGSSPYYLCRCVRHLRYRFLPRHHALSSAMSPGQTSSDLDDGKNANGDGGGLVSFQYHFCRSVRCSLPIPPRRRHQNLANLG